MLGISNDDCNNQGTDPNLVHKGTHDANGSHYYSSHEVYLGSELHDVLDMEGTCYAIGTHVRDYKLVEIQSVHTRFLDIQGRNQDGARSTHTLDGDRV